jgi:hypothetical protein
VSTRAPYEILAVVAKMAVVVAARAAAARAMVVRSAAARAAAARVAATRAAARVTRLIGLGLRLGLGFGLGLRLKPTFDLACCDARREVANLRQERHWG